MDVGWNDLGACQEGGVILPLAIGSANSALGQVGRHIHVVCSMSRLQEGLYRVLFKHRAPIQLLPEDALDKAGQTCCFPAVSQHPEDPMLRNDLGHGTKQGRDDDESILAYLQFVFTCVKLLLMPKLAEPTPETKIISL